MISGPLLIIAVLGYLVAAVLYAALLFKEHIVARSTWLAIARIAGTGGLVAHTAAIGVHCITTHHTPLTTSPETLSATGWAIALAYTCVDFLQRRKPASAVGAFAFPLAFLSVFFGASLSAFTPEPSAALGILNSQLVALHVMAVLTAFGLLTLAVCCGALYLIEHRMLKRKQIAKGLFSRLPPLANIDHLAFTLVLLGFPLLTIGLAAGFVRAIAGHMLMVDPRVLLAVTSWAIFGGYLVLHSSRLVIGVRGNYLLFAGELPVLLTFFIHSPLHNFS